MTKQSELRKMLAIGVGAQEFCLDVMIVREIRGWSPATPLPRTPAYVVGMVNLRGGRSSPSSTSPPGWALLRRNPAFATSLS
jgi:hypothetical protein